MSKIDREKWNQRYLDEAFDGPAEANALLREWVGKTSAGRALDVACGVGRNALYLAERGFNVDAVDISGAALDLARAAAQARGLRINWLEHDLDVPLARTAPYRLIVIVHYVNLPLIQQLAASLAPGGLLVCEEHLVTDEDVIGPTNPAYRVTSGDLLAAVKGLKIHHLEEVWLPQADGRSAALVRLVAGS